MKTLLSEFKPFVESTISCKPGSQLYQTNETGTENKVYSKL